MKTLDELVKMAGLEGIDKTKLYTLLDLAVMNDRAVHHGQNMSGVQRKYNQVVDEQGKQSARICTLETEIGAVVRILREQFGNERMNESIQKTVRNRRRKIHPSSKDE